MNARLPILATVAAVLVIIFILRWSRERTETVPPSTAPVVAKPVLRVKLPERRVRPPAAQPAEPAPDPRFDFADEIRRRIEQPGTRRNEAILTFKDREAYDAFLARAGKSGLHVSGRLDAVLALRVRYDSADALMSDVVNYPNDYADAGGNFLVHIPSAPPAEQRAAGNHAPFGNNALNFLGVESDHSRWGRGATIAILDSGVSADPTLQGRLRALDIGYGTTVGTGEADGHGTAVAALAAGAAGDASGVAPAANLLSIRVTDADGLSDLFTLSNAIIAAVDAGAAIINVSMGGYGTNTALSRAIDYAAQQGAVVVAAAGNDQAAQLTWPAADPRVVSVGAIDALEQQVTFSNSGPQLQITAPGYGVQTAWADGRRVMFDGTSASAPIVSGAIAAIMSENPTLNAAQAWQVLQQHANDGGAPGADRDYGNGILNLGWAMNRNNGTRVDTAVSSHYYNTVTGQMEFVVQNRGALPLAGLQLNVDANGATTPYQIPTLAPAATSVVRVPVDQTVLTTTGRLFYRTQLINPTGTIDQIPANNRKASSLTAPAK